MTRAWLVAVGALSLLSLPHAVFSQCALKASAGDSGVAINIPASCRCVLRLVCRARLFVAERDGLCWCKIRDLCICVVGAACVAARVASKSITRAAR